MGKKTLHIHIGDSVGQEATNIARVALDKVKRAANALALPRDATFRDAEAARQALGAVEDAIKNAIIALDKVG